ncbi:MAG TPA: hypothetical protein VIY48_11690 [Candidatus Paceibacterota bacterium]
MMGSWLKKPEPEHTTCVKPVIKRGWIGGVWRCRCGKLWVHRTGWYFGEFPPWFYGTMASWHEARWWERIKWRWNKPVLAESEETLIDACEVQE